LSGKYPHERLERQQYFPDLAQKIPDIITAFQMSEFMQEDLSACMEASTVNGRQENCRMEQTCQKRTFYTIMLEAPGVE